MISCFKSTSWCLPRNLLVQIFPTKPSEPPAQFMSTQEQPDCSHLVPQPASSKDRTPSDGSNAKQLQSHRSAGIQTIMSPFPTAWTCCLASAAADVGTNVTSPLLVLPCFLLTWPHARKYQPASLSRYSRPAPYNRYTPTTGSTTQPNPPTSRNGSSGPTAHVLHHRPADPPPETRSAPSQLKDLAPSSDNTYPA